MATDAAKFYGKAYTPERAELLGKAVKYLDMGVRAEVNGETNKVEMAFSAALRAETSAFAGTTT
jgi:hypothetical protein